MSAMIARVWKGWTCRANADAYERLLREEVIPNLKLIEGARGAYVLRQDGPDEVEFVMMSFFETIEAVKAFAGWDHTAPVLEPEARRLLSRIEPLARHYEVKETLDCLL